MNIELKMDCSRGIVNLKNFTWKTEIFSLELHPLSEAPKRARQGLATISHQNYIGPDLITRLYKDYRNGKISEAVYLATVKTLERKNENPYVGMDPNYVR